MWEILAYFNAVGWIATAIIGWRLTESYYRRFQKNERELRELRGEPVDEDDLAWYP